MKYNYIAVYNADIFEWFYRYNFIVILNDRYELVSHCSHFGHNNCHFRNIVSPDTCKTHSVWKNYKQGLHTKHFWTMVR